MKTLSLFNGVLSRESNEQPLLTENGLVIESGALWAKDRIVQYYKEKLDEEELNKTFHKSWQKIKESSRFELFIEQVQHYISTYGSNFEDEIYMPDEISSLAGTKIKLPVVRAYSKEEMTDKCLDILKSGIALKEETINDILSVLVEELNYQFTGEEGIKNKEAVIKIADLYNVLPTNILEFFRYIIYRATGESLLIKNDEAIEQIKESNYNPSVQFNKFGLIKLAEIFNRFKPLFLAFKPKCGSTINKISKLSKKYHKPLIENPLNNATNQILEKEDLHWLENATPFSLFRALSACYSRMNGQNSFVYRIRNGKSWVKTEQLNRGVSINNFYFILNYLKNKYSLKGKTVYLPEDIEYALPTSEKMFVGNIPTGTKFYGDKLAIGVYWKDSWGASDLDLSGVNIGGKVGWNSSYNQDNGNLMYSGDITSAPQGAAEYLYADKGLKAPTLIQNNVYSGENDCEYKIIVGRGDDITMDYMMNAEKLFVETKCKSVQKQTILGVMLPEKTRQSFVLLNFGAGSARISGDSEVSRMATNALLQQWSIPFTFNKLLTELGAETVDLPEKADFSFDLTNLDKNSFVKIWKSN